MSDTPPPTIEIEEVPVTETPNEEAPVPPPPTPAAEETAEPGELNLDVSVLRRCANLRV